LLRSLVAELVVARYDDPGDVVHAVGELEREVGRT
jgi:hypothetical protein